MRKREQIDVTSKKGKEKLIKKYTPKSTILKDCTLAFIFGGLICLGAELLRRLYLSLGADEKTSLTLVSLSLIFLASTLTALGVFDRIAKYAGAGTLVPITGFSNSVTSEAIDSKSEGIVLGVGAKIFTVAGPVILFGLTSGVVYGIVLFIIEQVKNMM